MIANVSNIQEKQRNIDIAKKESGGGWDEEKAIVTLPVSSWIKLCNFNNKMSKLLPRYWRKRLKETNCPLFLFHFT